MTHRKPKILLFDIETAPLRGFMWGIWQQNISYDKQLESDWFMLSFSAKWLGTKKPITKGLPTYKKAYAKDTTDDSELAKDLWKLIDEADIVITHNGNKFDIKKIQERFVAHGLPPTSPFKSVDTLTAARRHFAFTSNKMDSIATRLGLDNKMSHEGFELWKKCLQGQKKAWSTMLKYNQQDIKVLEDVYLKVRPWMVGHPSLSVYTPEKETCPTCGGNHVAKADKNYFTDSLEYQMYQCGDCHTYSRARTNVKSKGSDLPLRGINRR